MKQNPETVSPMSNEGRNAYVIEHLTSALFELLEERPLEEITVSALCSRAGVGRASFYRNYQRREDIVRAHLVQLLRGWQDAYGPWDGHPLHETIGSLFGHFEAHRSFYTLLSRRGLVYLLKDALLDAVGYRPELERVEAYARAYAAYTLYGWIETWFRRGMRESAQEMEEMFRNAGL